MEVICATHKQVAKFICLLNEWHCVPLCAECIPEHSNSHLLNKTLANIQSLPAVVNQNREKLAESSRAFSEQRELVHLLLTSSIKDDANLANLRKVRQLVVDAVNHFFDEQEAQYLKIYQETEARKNESYRALQQHLDADISEVQQLLLDLKDDSNVAKGIQFSFAKNFTSKLEGYKQRLEEIQQQAANYAIRCQESNLKHLDECLQSLIAKTELPTKEQAQQAEAKAQQKLLQQQSNLKKTKCPQCGQQMTYVSDFKKHLTCPNCS